MNNDARSGLRATGGTSGRASSCAGGRAGSCTRCCRSSRDSDLNGDTGGKSQNLVRRWHHSPLGPPELSGLPTQLVSAAKRVTKLHPKPKSLHLHPGLIVTGALCAVFPVESRRVKPILVPNIN